MYISNMANIVISAGFISYSYQENGQIVKITCILGRVFFKHNISSESNQTSGVYKHITRSIMYEKAPFY